MPESTKALVALAISAAEANEMSRLTEVIYLRLVGGAWIRSGSVGSPPFSSRS